MKLSDDDVAQFYKIMHPLQLFVNQRLKILPSCTSLDAYVAESPDERVKGILRSSTEISRNNCLKALLARGWYIQR